MCVREREQERERARERESERGQGCRGIKGASWTFLSLTVIAPRVLLILLAEVVVLDVEERWHVISRRHSRELD